MGGVGEGLRMASRGEGVLRDGGASSVVEPQGLDRLANNPLADGR